MPEVGLISFIERRMQDLTLFGWCLDFYSKTTLNTVNAGKLRRERQETTKHTYAHAMELTVFEHIVQMIAHLSHGESDDYGSPEGTFRAKTV